MYRIVAKRRLTPNAKLFEVEAPTVARKARPGQFIILRAHERGERIPITIAGASPGSGTIKFVVAEVGRTSKMLGDLAEGEVVLNLAGPLGNPLEAENRGTVLCVGGGVYVGALLYQIGALRQAGNRIVSVIGARSADHLTFVDEVRAASDELHVATDDGSAGYRGLDFLGALLKKRRFDHVYAIGPTAMQRALSDMTRPCGIPTTVNLFPIMVDGTGMCGACRVEVEGKTRFACVDGPAFDGHGVDFDQLEARMRLYTPQEKIAMVLREEAA